MRTCNTARAADGFRVKLGDSIRVWKTKGTGMRESVRLEQATIKTLWAGSGQPAQAEVEAPDGSKHHIHLFWGAVEVIKTK